jgi:hypothetical protein
MKQILFYLAGIIFMLVSGCKGNNQPASGSETTTDSEKAALTSAKPAQRYGIKSGMVVYKAPMEMKQTLYFDDYGQREVQISEMAVAGMSIKNIDIRKDGFTYQYKEGEKTGMKMKWNVQDQNYDKVDPEILKRFKLKDLGTEEMAGKKCKKFSMETGGSPVYAWIWNGISIKTITNMMGKEFVIEAIKIEEGPVPAAIFEIPADVTFTEMN